MWPLKTRKSTGNEIARLVTVLFQLLVHQSGTAIGRTAIEISMRMNGMTLQ